MMLDQRKIDLIQRIARSTDVATIDAVDKLLTGTVARQIDLSRHMNIKPTFDLEGVKKRRPRKPFDIQAFFAETESLEWEQSIEELLADLD